MRGRAEWNHASANLRGGVPPVYTAPTSSLAHTGKWNKVFRRWIGSLIFILPVLKKQSWKNWYIQISQKQLQTSVSNQKTTSVLYPRMMVNLSDLECRGSVTLAAAAC